MNNIVIAFDNRMQSGLVTAQSFFGISRYKAPVIDQCFMLYPPPSNFNITDDKSVKLLAVDKNFVVL